jgi:hypothetical protein
LLSALNSEERPSAPPRGMRLAAEALARSSEALRCRERDDLVGYTEGDSSAAKSRIATG